MSAGGEGHSEVRNNEAMRRYELDVEGHVAFTEYKLGNGEVTFLHTEVPSELSGRGVGSALAAGALDAVRETGLKVVPRCEFIAHFIKRHPAYQDLVA